MPRVGRKHYPYTKKGRAAATKARKRRKRKKKQWTILSSGKVNVQFAVGSTGRGLRLKTISSAATFCSESWNTGTSSIRKHDRSNKTPNLSGDYRCNNYCSDYIDNWMEDGGYRDSHWRNWSSVRLFGWSKF